MCPVLRDRRFVRTLTLWCVHAFYNHLSLFHFSLALSLSVRLLTEHFIFILQFIDCFSFFSYACTLFIFVWLFVYGWAVPLLFTVNHRKKIIHNKILAFTKYKYICYTWMISSGELSTTEAVWYLRKICIYHVYIFTVHFYVCFRQKKQSESCIHMVCALYE